MAAQSSAERDPRPEALDLIVTRVQTRSITADEVAELDIARTQGEWTAGPFGSCSAEFENSNCYTALSASPRWGGFANVVTRYMGVDEDCLEGVANLKFIEAAPRMAKLIGEQHSKIQELARRIEELEKQACFAMSEDRSQDLEQGRWS